MQHISRFHKQAGLVLKVDSDSDDEENTVPATQPDPVPVQESHGPMTTDQLLRAPTLTPEKAIQRRGPLWLLSKVELGKWRQVTEMMMLLAGKQSAQRCRQSCWNIRWAARHRRQHLHLARQSSHLRLCRRRPKLILSRQRPWRVRLQCPLRRRRPCRGHLCLQVFLQLQQRQHRQLLQPGFLWARLPLQRALLLQVLRARKITSQLKMLKAPTQARKSSWRNSTLRARTGFSICDHMWPQAMR